MSPTNEERRKTIENILQVAADDIIKATTSDEVNGEPNPLDTPGDVIEPRARKVISELFKQLGFTISDMVNLGNVYGLRSDSRVRLVKHPRYDSATGTIRMQIETRENFANESELRSCLDRYGIMKGKGQIWCKESGYEVKRDHVIIEFKYVPPFVRNRKSI
jgi:mannose-6-phosphate isomerase-like protein (cupin superfamily)